MSTRMVQLPATAAIESPLVGCPGPGVFLSAGAFVRGVFCPGDFFPGGRLPGGTFGRGDFWPGDFCPGVLLSGGLMPVPPNFNAYTHSLSFLCLAS